MEKRLMYDAKVNQYVRHTATLATAQNYALQLDYLYKHNTICPLCKTPFKVGHDNTLRQIGIVGVGVYPKEQLVIPYVLCKICAKKKLGKTDGNEIEQTILTTLQLH